MVCGGAALHAIVRQRERMHDPAIAQYACQALVATDRACVIE